MAWLGHIIRLLDKKPGPHDKTSSHMTTSQKNCVSVRATHEDCEHIVLAFRISFQISTFFNTDLFPFILFYFLFLLAFVTIANTVDRGKEILAGLVLCLISAPASQSCSRPLKVFRIHGNIIWISLREIELFGATEM